jgi:hypothetical protein
LVAANIRLPGTAAECERLIPRLRPAQVIVRIYDYGNSPLAPPAQAVSIVRPGPIRAVKGSHGVAKGFAESRIRFAGHTLIVQIGYGAGRPPADGLRAVKQFLRGAHLAG